MKKYLFVLLSLNLLGCIMFQGCSDENESLPTSKTQYSDEEILQIEQLIDKYKINVSIPYQSSNGGLPSILELNDLFKCISEFQNALHNVKLVKATSDSTINFTIEDSKIPRIIKRNGETYTGSYSAKDNCCYGTFHFTFSWKNIDAQKDDNDCDMQMKCYSTGSSNYEFQSSDKYTCKKQGNTVTYTFSYTVVLTTNDQEKVMGKFTVEGHFDIASYSKNPK